MARKRSHRVSFAETTAVYVFDRDEDSETSPSSGTAAPSPAPASEPFQGDNPDSQDSKASTFDDDEDEDDGEQKLFVRDMDSPSPSSAMGSVTSNDDDNFFGPVSASFIRSVRLSESGMSEDNEHDVTLDSTAFSLLFRNVVPLDDRSVVGSIGTPVTDDEVYTNSGGSGGCFTPRSEGSVRSNSLLEENEFHPATPFNSTTTENERTLQSLKELASNDIPLHHFQEEIGSSVDFHLGSKDINILMKEDLFNVREKLPESEMFAPSSEPSGDAYKEAAIYSKTEVSEQCLPKPTALESTQGLCDGDDDDVAIQGLLSICESFPAQGVDIVKRKRRIKHTPLIEKDHMKERAHKSPKLIPKDIGNILGSSFGDHVELNNGANNIGGQMARKHWTDIISRVSEASKQLFPPSTYKLISLEVDLEDILDRLQKARKYERICTSLRNDERLVDPQKKRLAEARSLHDKLVFEQVKLQLKRVKLDLLHSKSQLSQSRIQECHKLKSSFSQHCCRGTTSRAHEIHLQSDSSNSNSRNQVARNKVDSMRQELEMLDQKVKLLVKYFESLCNIKENMDCNEIINVVNEHLEATNSCQNFLQDLQLWELSDIVKKNNQSDIVLNYRNLLFQRFTMNNGPISSIAVSNLLKNANIDKCFPNMNACLAFEFAFKAKDDRRMATLMCLQQETFVTNLLLGTILEMFEEVRASQITLMNLIFSAFHSPCSGSLELHLCFMSFKTGRKITLALDTTNLECAVYPSNPSELQLRMIASGEQSRAMLPTSVFDEITSAVQGLEVGRPMISRLCRRISQVVQGSSCN